MINNSETTTTTTTRPTTTTTKKFFIAFIPHDEDVGIEIPDPLLEDGPMVDGLQVRMGYKMYRNAKDRGYSNFYSRISPVYQARDKLRLQQLLSLDPLDCQLCPW